MAYASSENMMSELQELLKDMDKGTYTQEQVAVKGEKILNTYSTIVIDNLKLLRQNVNEICKSADTGYKECLEMLLECTKNPYVELEDLKPIALKQEKLAELYKDAQSEHKDCEKAVAGFTLQLETILPAIFGNETGGLSYLKISSSLTGLLRRAVEPAKRLVDDATSFQLKYEKVERYINELHKKSENKSETAQKLLERLKVQEEKIKSQIKAGQGYIKRIQMVHGKKVIVSEMKQADMNQYEESVIDLKKNQELLDSSRQTLDEIAQDLMDICGKERTLSKFRNDGFKLVSEARKLLDDYEKDAKEWSGSDVKKTMEKKWEDALEFQKKNKIKK